MFTSDDGLVRLRPRDDCLYVSRGRTVLITGRDGFVDGVSEQGLFTHLTRIASTYRYWIDGLAPVPSGLSNVAQHNWLGYYLALPRNVDDPHDPSHGPSGEIAQRSLELRLIRVVGEGLHEDIDLTNFTQQQVTCRLELEVDADFAGLDEARHGRRQRGRRVRRWREEAGGAPDAAAASGTPGACSLVFDYRARHRYEEDGERGVATLHRGVAFRIDRADSRPSYVRGRIRFDITLAPRATWRACVTAVPYADGRPLPVHVECRSFVGSGDYGRRTWNFLSGATAVSAPTSSTLTPVVVKTVERACRDLAALRLFDLDTDRGWLAAAGLPVYLGVFGRDSLTAAWQGALLGPEMMAGTLPVITRLQGKAVNRWRDEEPGRMVHQADTGPTTALNLSPFGRYYGSMTTSGFYPVVVSELWHWTGDKDLVQPFLDPALAALRWLDESGDLDGDGFYEYRTRSRLGLQNQGWKDSGDAIVHEDGSIVAAPIATCEEQAFVYVAKLQLAEVLWWFDRKDEARRLYREADDLRSRFHDLFWLEDLGFLAMGLGPDKQPIRSVGSNALHCIAAGIARKEVVERIVDRLFAADMFSGWGIRTLSAAHPAYNPYSYHRGSVWPVEHGAFAIGLLRYGLHERLHTICRAQFEAAALFEGCRLPELFGGHQRTETQPFPALYPFANTPQAWSASSVFCYVQALTGVYPYAPLNLLLVDPHLPDWLPEITLEQLRVGAGTVTIHFTREANGRTDYRVLDKRGPLHVVRQPSPWSLTAGAGERIVDALMSLAPGH